MSRNITLILHILGVLAIISAFTSPVFVTAPVRATNTYKIVGYISFESMYNIPNIIHNINIAEIDYLIYSNILITSSTDPTLRMNGGVPTTYLSDVVKVAHDAGKKALVSLGALSELGDILSNSGHRETFITNLLKLVSDYKFDGVDIDWEEDPLYTNHTTLLHNLIVDLYNTLNPQGKFVTAYIWRSHADFGIDVASQPYLKFLSCSRYTEAESYSETQLNNLYAAGWTKDKLIEGLPLYGWDSSSSTICTYSDIINEFNPATSVNSIATSTVKTVFNGGRPITVKGGTLYFSGWDRDKTITDFVKNNSFGGIMFWEVGYDKVNDSRSILGQVYNEFYPNYSAPTITISAATSVTSTTARLNGNITARGGVNPTVTFYWGTSNGGNIAGNWAHSSAPTSPSQPQGVASFNLNLTGLSSNTKYYFNASATNSAWTSWAGSSLNFTTLSALALTTSSLANGKVGVASSQTLAATGGTAPYTWSIATGSLPAGLTLSSSGVISGTPSRAGTFSFTVQVTDGTAARATKVLSIAINTDSGKLAVITAAKNKLIWGTQPPSTVTAGATWPPFTVKIADRYNNQTSDTDSVTIAPSFGTLGGTLSNTSVAGLAAFNDISRTLAGNLTLTATSGSLTAARASSIVTINPAAAIQVRVESAANGTGSVIQNTNILAANSLTGYAVTRDQYGNYIANVAGTWSLANKTGGIADTDLVPSNDAKSAVFTAHLAGSTNIHVACSNVATVDSRIISVSPTPTSTPIVSRGGGGGGSLPPPVIKPLTITGFTSTSDLKVDTSGTVQAGVQLKLQDGSATLDIPKNTKLADINGNAIGALFGAKLDLLPQPPPDQKLIVLGYQFGPTGALFSPPLTLTCDPKTLPNGTDENKITLAFWDGSKWVSVDSKFDINTHTLTAQISHFFEYVLLTELAPAKFTLSDLRLTEDKSSPDHAVSIQTAVTNEGGSPGKYIVKLSLNSFGVNQKEVNLDAGKAETVSFELKNLIPAKYMVDINGKISQFTVEDSSPTLVNISPLQETAGMMPPASPSNLGEKALAAPLPQPKSSVPIIWMVLGIILALAMIFGLTVLKKAEQEWKSRKAGTNRRTIASTKYPNWVGNRELISPSATVLCSPKILDNRPLQINDSISENPKFQSISNKRVSGKSSWVRDTRKSLREGLTSNNRKMAMEETSESSKLTLTFGDFEKSDLFLEIATNAAAAKAPWIGKLLPFQTGAWGSSLYEIDILPAGILKELSEAYIDMRLANELVWLSEVLGRTSKGIEESYLKLCVITAERLDKTMTLAKKYS